MPVFPLLSWTPDQPDYQNPGVVVAKNVFPAAQGYLPVPQFEPLSDALGARPRGAIRTRDKDENLFEFAGDASKLYQNIDNVWTDRSKVGGYSTGSAEAWEFVRWKNKLLGTNFSDSPQAITFGAAAFADLTTDFRARHIAVIRDFVVVGNTFDVTDSEKPDRVRWSAFNNETDWTVSPSTLSDFQDLKTAAVERILGGEFGVVFQADSVWRMTFVGAPVVFQFDEVLPGIGTIAPGAVVRDGDRAYFLSSRGFFSLANGSQATPIGANRVDRFVLDDIDTDFLRRISATVDPNSHRVMWAYPGPGNISGTPNRIIIYDPTLDRWSLIERDVELLWSSGGTSTTLEGLDAILSSIDDLGTSLDSKIWQGSGRLLAAFDETFKNGQFRGAPMTGTIKTAEIEIHGGRRTRLSAFRPLVEGGTVTARVGTRNRQTDAAVQGSSLTQSASGRFTTRANARYHSFELTLTDDWQRAIGVQVERTEAKQGGRRG